MRIARTLGLGLTFSMLVACSPRDFLTRRLAADLISTSDTFKATQLFSLKTGIVSNKEFESPESLVLQRHGWIVGNPAKCPAGVEPAPCWDAILSPIGVETFQPLITNPVAASGLMSVQVARREVSEVTGISKAGNFADVDFTWHWVPLNDVGAALYDSGTRYRSTVAFRKYDDGWRVVTAPARNNQSMDEALRNTQPAP